MADTTSAACGSAARKYWIGDYTVEPENGGVGVFRTSSATTSACRTCTTVGNTGGAENSTGFWTLYSSGSYGSSGEPAEGIGSKPIQMSAYEKIFLGWSNYEVATAGQKASLQLGPRTPTPSRPSSSSFSCPTKRSTRFRLVRHAGSYFYFSGAGNNLDNGDDAHGHLAWRHRPVQREGALRHRVDWDYDVPT